MLCRSFAIHGSRVSKSEPLEPSSPLRVCVKRDLRLAMGNGVMFENVVNLGKSSLVAVSSSGMQWNLGGEKKREGFDGGTNNRTVCDSWETTVKCKICAAGQESTASCQRPGRTPLWEGYFIIIHGSVSSLKRLSLDQWG